MRRFFTTAIASCAILAGIGFIIVKTAGSPISTDLTIVGKGKPSLVLVYENFSPVGGDALNRLSKVSGEYEARLAIAVADLGVPDGNAFAERHDLANGQALFLTADGQPRRAITIPADEQTLRRLLDTQLAELP